MSNLLEEYFENWPDKFHPVRLTIVESPYAGDVKSNTAYAQRACKDCIQRGEIPFASHLICPQFLDYSSPTDHQIGIGIGYYFWEQASLIAFYLDKGWSSEMLAAKKRIEGLQSSFIHQEIRYLD